MLAKWAAILNENPAKINISSGIVYVQKNVGIAILDLHYLGNTLGCQSIVNMRKNAVMSEPVIIDKDLIQGYLDNLGGTVVNQMLELYKKQSSVYLSDIESAITEQSQQQWQARCHKMKGAAGSVGLLSVHQFLVDIEKSTAPWPQKSELIARLVSANSNAIAEFERWLGA